MRKTLSLLVLSAVVALTSHAKITLPGYFTNNMVLQQNSSLTIHGTAKKNAKVTVRLGWDAQPTVVRADADGRWAVDVAVPSAGGPYTLSFSDGKELKLSNVYSGEVWFCSGQSNREMPLAGWGRIMNYEAEIAAANHPRIHLLQVENTTALVPHQEVNLSMGGWQPCTPSTVPGFSSAAYFFARHITNNIPDVHIGIIDSTWGGTPAEAWTSLDMLATLPEFSEEANRARDIHNTDSIIADYNARMKAWNDRVIALDAGMSVPGTWASRKTDTKTWKTLPLAGVWEENGMEDFDGVVWFKRTLNIPAEFAGKDVTLSIGMIDDDDITYLNGVEIGSTTGWDKPRRYTIPASKSRAGECELTVRVFDNRGNGGVYGDASEFYLECNGKRLAITGDWKYAVGVSKDKYGDAPSSPLGGQFPSYPAILYNAMVNPFIGFPIKGAIWYQGESNEGRSDSYSVLFPSMICDWRDKWGYDFPFYFVQLANFRNPQYFDANSGWAPLREAQTKALELSNTGMAVTIERGLADDIHPKDKQEVGRRLAELALNTTYGVGTSVTPMYKSHTVDGDCVTVRFTVPVVAKNGKAEGFVVAGPDRVFHRADGEVKDGCVVLRCSEVKHPMAVRYGWSDNPTCNVYGAGDMPLSPFRTDRWKVAQ